MELRSSRCSHNANFDARQTDDFVTAVWRKLCLNCAGAVSAVLLKGAGISHHDGVADLMRTLVRECTPSDGPRAPRWPTRFPDDIVAGARRAPKDAGNSMLADRRAGRPMEIDARNGVIVRLGRKHGIAAPMNSLMVALLEAAQED
jgi:2-dehydropantoate 2-reductase